MCTYVCTHDDDADVDTVLATLLLLVCGGLVFEFVLLIWLVWQICMRLSMWLRCSVSETSDDVQHQLAILPSRRRGQDLTTAIAMAISNSNSNDVNKGYSYSSHSNQSKVSCHHLIIMSLCCCSSMLCCCCFLHCCRRSIMLFLVLVSLIGFW